MFPLCKDFQCKEYVGFFQELEESWNELEYQLLCEEYGSLHRQERATNKKKWYIFRRMDRWKTSFWRESFIRIEWEGNQWMDYSRMGWSPELESSGLLNSPCFFCSATHQNSNVDPAISCLHTFEMHLVLNCCFVLPLLEPVLFINSH